MPPARRPLLLLFTSADDTRHVITLMMRCAIIDMRERCLLLRERRRVGTGQAGGKGAAPDATRDDAAAAKMMPLLCYARRCCRVPGMSTMTMKRREQRYVIDIARCHDAAVADKAADIFAKRLLYAYCRAAAMRCLPLLR